MENPVSPSLQPILDSILALVNAGPDALLKASETLTQSFRVNLQRSMKTMLPSYMYKLPCGTETGTVTALDLGGSTLRVAVVTLHGQPRIDDKGHLEEIMSIKGRKSWHVKDEVKSLPAREFFDWVVERIYSVLQILDQPDGGNMCMGVTWSFPVESTSIASGKVQEMGKGYQQWKSIADTDLKSHFSAAFIRRGLRLRMTALMNDTEATLLSHAYTNPDTRISLIWGTGINAAVQLPVEAISPQKIGGRPQSWTRKAKAVLVNTEVSMFGTGVFPLSEADAELDRNSSQPGFQPLEQLTSGRYLGEIFRLSMLGAIQHGALLGGQVPEGIRIPYSFDTAMMSRIEVGGYECGAKVLMAKYGFSQPPSAQDMTDIRAIAKAVSTRAATYMAVMLFSLYQVQNYPTGFSTEVGSHSTEPCRHVTIAYCGAVAEKHPTARLKCQQILDELLSRSRFGREGPRLVLEPADDSGLLGAAVGAAMNGNNGLFGSKI